MAALDALEPMQAMVMDSAQCHEHLASIRGLHTLEEHADSKDGSWFGTTTPRRQRRRSTGSPGSPVTPVLSDADAYLASVTVDTYAEDDMLVEDDDSCESMGAEPMNTSAARARPPPRRYSCPGPRPAGHAAPAAEQAQNSDPHPVDADQALDAGLHGLDASLQRSLSASVAVSRSSSLGGSAGSVSAAHAAIFVRSPHTPAQAAPAQPTSWVPLEAGCVWGTPVGPAAVPVMGWAATPAVLPSSLPSALEAPPPAVGAEAVGVAAAGQLPAISSAQDAGSAPPSVPDTPVVATRSMCSSRSAPQLLGSFPRTAALGAGTTNSILSMAMAMDHVGPTVMSVLDCDDAMEAATQLPLAPPLPGLTPGDIARCRSGGAGPLGLRLRKSESLLDLINGALAGQSGIVA